MKKEALFWGGATTAYGLILLAFAAVEDVLMRGLWRPFDIASYYGLASSVIDRFNAAVGASASSPLLPVQAGALSGYQVYAVGLLALAGALLVLEIGRRSYGNAAGFLAGLLFTLDIAWALGNLTVAEALGLVFVLLSARFLLSPGRGYYPAGLGVGAAVCFKPLATLVLVASVLLLYRRAEMKGAPALVAGALTPLFLLAIIAFAAYGADTPARAAGSGFEAVGFTAAGTPDALMAIANMVMAACTLASLLPLALLGFFRRSGRMGEYFLVAGLGFITTLALRQYLSYWFIALPFLALLCVGVFQGRRAHG